MNKWITKGAENPAVEIVLLHGRGGSGEGMMQLAPILNIDSARFHSITAPGNAWYPKPFTRPKKANEPFLSQNKTMIKEKLMQLQKKEIPIVLAGFSQGACLTLEIGKELKLDLLLAFSGGLIGESQELEVSKNCSDNVFIGCSNQDPYIPEERVRESVKLYEEQGAKVKTLIYPGRSHHISAEEEKLARELISELH